MFPAANALGPTLNIAKLQADKIEHRFNILNEILALECSALARHLCSISFTPGLVLTGKHRYGTMMVDAAAGMGAPRRRSRPCPAMARARSQADRRLALCLCADWWLTIFSRHFAPEIVGRIWDCFLLEGEPLLFRAAVAVFKYFEVSCRLTRRATDEHAPNTCPALVVPLAFLGKCQGAHRVLRLSLSSRHPSLSPQLSARPLQR